MEREFSRNAEGNVGLVFGVMAMTLVIGAGTSLDYAMAVNVKTKMQNALDAAATAVCVTPGEDPDVTIRARLTNSISEFGLQLAPPPPEGQTQGAPSGSEAVVINTSFDPATGALAPSMTTNLPTSLLAIAGIGEIGIDVETQVSCASKRLELSLMLDVSGSMSSTVNGVVKIDSMKQAALDVVDIFKTSLAIAHTRIALVPFAKGVKLGTFAEAARGAVIPGTQTTPGSDYFQFDDWNGDQHTWQITDCVTERTGPEAYTDAPPSTAYVGRMYRQGGSCMTGTNLTIVPLTSDAAALEATINGYQTDGNTAGQIGSAWAWYTLSDKWTSFWPTGSQPEQPDEDELIKATILMTDGQYNTQYCNSVDDDTINCTALNGSAQDQAAALCQAMKDSGIVVYTVGFDISSGSSQESLMKNCATDNTKWFFPYDGDELRTAFQTIGKSLAKAQSGFPIVQK